MRYYVANINGVIVNIFKLFRKITAADLVRQQLHEAEVQLLRSKESEEYYAAVSDMYSKRVRRLSALAERSKESS